MKPAQLKIFQALIDVAIPLLGYFFWNWDFYFILLFIVLDFLVFCVFSFVKVNKINAHNGITSKLSLKNLGFTLLLVFTSFVLIYFALLLVNPQFELVKQTWAFLAYKDLGIAQGIVLLPLLAYGGYTQYKMQFLMPGKFATTHPAEIWKTHFTTLFLVLAVSGLFLGLSFLVVFPEIVYILTLIFGVAAYRFLYAR